MNFQQLRFVREAVRRSFNLAEVAAALSARQPGVSRAIKELEDELGVESFVRWGNRLVGLTEPGRALIDVVDRMLNDAQNLRRIADQFSGDDAGGLIMPAAGRAGREPAAARPLARPLPAGFEPRLCVADFAAFAGRERAGSGRARIQRSSGRC